MSRIDYDKMLEIMLDGLRYGEAHMRNEIEIVYDTSNGGHTVAAEMVSRLKKAGYEAWVREDHFPNRTDCCYTVVAKCKYPRHFDRLDKEMYALLDTRNGEIVSIPDHGRLAYAIFPTLGDALGKKGMKHDEIVRHRGVENIRLITMKMDQDITKKAGN